MRRALVLVLILLASCGSSRDDAERKAREARGYAEARAAEAQAAAAQKAEQAVDRAASARAKAAAAVADATRMRTIAAQAKAELDKVYATRSAYDLDIDTPAATAAHAQKLAAMPHVTVGDLTVGYEEASAMSVTGTSSRRHFRATWRRGDRDVIVGYQTEGTLDLVAFAKLLHKLVPIVNAML